MTRDQIERGQKLQKAMESIDAQVERDLSDQLRADEEVRRVADERADIEEIRRAASVSGKLMDARYGWVNQKG